MRQMSAEMHRDTPRLSTQVVTRGEVAVWTRSGRDVQARLNCGAVRERRMCADSRFKTLFFSSV
jgi:hypothetical protein